MPNSQSVRAKHVPTTAGFHNLAFTEFYNVLSSAGYSDMKICEIVRAVNSHESLMLALEHCKQIKGVDETDQETGETFSDGIDKAITQAEGGK